MWKLRCYWLELVGYKALKGVVKCPSTLGHLPGLFLITSVPLGDGGDGGVRGRVGHEAGLERGSTICKKTKIKKKRPGIAHLKKGLIGRPGARIPLFFCTTLIAVGFELGLLGVPQPSHLVWPKQNLTSE